MTRVVVDGSTLTAAELVALVEAPSIHVDAGLELLDSAGVLIEDISDDFQHTGSRIDRNIYRTVHATATLNVARELQWGSQRLRPYLLLSDDRATWYRFDLGVFLMSTPERMIDETPQVWSVACFDLLDLINTPHGRSYSLSSGSNVVAAVVELLEDAGITSVNIEASATVSGSTQVMSIADDWTTLGIVNELLDSIGYRAVYADPKTGVLRSEPYRSPTDLPTIWTYSADSETTTVAQQRSATADFYRAANEVVGIRDVVEDSIPVDGDGIHTETNQSDGPTSIDSRGFIIRRVIRGEYADQASLVTAVQAALDTEKRVTNYVTISVSPTPVHGHFDVVRFHDDAIPVDGRFLVTGYTLPLDGSDMTLEMRGV